MKAKMFHLSDEVCAALKEFAFTSNTSQVQVVHNALWAYLKRAPYSGYSGVELMEQAKIGLAAPVVADDPPVDRSHMALDKVKKQDIRVFKRLNGIPDDEEELPEF
jgi:hypothetical protein